MQKFIKLESIKLNNVSRKKCDLMFVVSEGCRAATQGPLLDHRSHRRETKGITFIINQGVPLKTLQDILTKQRISAPPWIRQKFSNERMNMKVEFCS